MIVAQFVHLVMLAAFAIVSVMRPRVVSCLASDWYNFQVSFRLKEVGIEINEIIRHANLEVVQGKWLMHVL